MPLVLSAVLTGVGIFALKYLILVEQLEELKKFEEYKKKMEEEKDDKETE